jgi:hypothetical protein
MTATMQKPPRNGVDVPTLFATIDAVKGRQNSPGSNSGQATNGSAVPTAAP